MVYLLCVLFITAAGRDQVLAMTLGASGCGTRLFQHPSPGVHRGLLVGLPAKSSNVALPTKGSRLAAPGAGLTLSFAKVYRQCYKRFHRRVTKRKDQLGEFWDHFKRGWDSDDSFEKQLHRVLIRAMEIPKVDNPCDEGLNGVINLVKMLTTSLNELQHDDVKVPSVDRAAMLDRKMNGSRIFKSWLSDRTIRPYVYPTLVAQNTRITDANSINSFSIITSSP
jgi:hypothetical protein